MRRWKVFLAMLCAMLAAVGLFACKDDDPEEQLSGNDIQTITRVSGHSGLSFTDADKWDDVVGTLQEKITVRCRTADKETIDVAGKDCTFISGIETDGEGHFKVGAYSIKVQPTNHNPKNVSQEFNVQITHDFEAGATADDPEVCSYCGATRLTADENTVIHYGSFHSGTNNKVPAKVYGEDGTNGAVYTNKNIADSKKTYIEEFGNVDVATNGVTESLKVPTLTVGQLEPGMTITVKGKAQTSWTNWGLSEDAGYYFPVIGFADRYNNAPVWEGAPATGYTGGTAVFVRGEGWVLYNGIDSTSSGKTRPLSALSLQTYGQIGNGTGEARNYGSHELATLGTNEKRPESFTPGNVPAVNDWVDWVVYSTGNTNPTTSYNDLVDITLTWNYRQDGIIEMTYNVNGSALTAMVKVPEATMGYYDTMLHGDYVDMFITSYERIETRTPSSFAVKEVTPKNYYEGEAFDPSTINAVFTYKQSGSTEYPQGLTLANIFATTEATVSESTQWISLAEKPAVLSTYKNFKVQVSKGNELWTDTFAADGKVSVVGNKIESVAGADVGVFKNNNTVGMLVLGTDGTNVTVTPVGDVYVQTIPTGATWTNGTLADGVEYRYVALHIGGSGFETITAVKSGKTDVPYYYDNGDLVLALTEETKTVKVEGLQTTATIFDFSEAKGFKVNEELNKTTDGGNWSLNNTANTVTVTFTPNSGKTINLIEIGIGSTATFSFRGPQSLIDYLAKGNALRNGIKITQNGGTKWENGVLTLVVEFPAADVANYMQPEIRIYVDNEKEFVFKIDYVADFIETNNFDSGWYSYVANGKIYLAQKASADGSALTMNLNAGNENVALIDLGYTFEGGIAAFKNASALTGSQISVLEIAGEYAVVIEVDPAKYGVKDKTFGYQLKEENYSDRFFAVENNAATLTDIVGGKTLILNEGSCLEKGLSGNFVKSGNVSFVASPVEFAGSHSTAFKAAGETCALCGEKTVRTKLNTVTLHDNEYVEIADAFNANTGKFTQMYHGLTVKLTVGSEFYWFRNDGFVSFNDYATALESDNFTTSFGEETAQRTPLGKIDDEGNLIPDEKSYLAVLNAGAAFRIHASYQDGTFTLIWRVYRKGADMKNYGTPYFAFEHKLSGLTGDMKVSFGADGIGGNQIGNNGTIWSFSGNLEKSMIDGVTAEAESNVGYTVGNFEKHFATVSATGGNATAITPTLKEQLGDEYTKYVSFDIDLTDTSYAAQAKVYTDAAFTTEYKGALATVESGKISMTVAFNNENAPAIYYVDLRSANGNTKQADIKINLSAVSMYDTKAVVTNNAAIVTGGTVEIAYTELPDLTGAKFSVNGVEADIAASMSFGTGVTATWENSMLTLTFAPQANLTAVPEYTVSLLDGSGKAAATSQFGLTAYPVAGGNVFEKENGKVYGMADGNKLYLYLFGEAATGTDFLEFSANNATTIANAAAKLLPYNLAYSVAGNNVAFTLNNDFTKSITAAHFENGAFKVTQFVIDLSYFEIAADAEYYFYILTAASEQADGYFTVAASRTVSATEVVDAGKRVPAIRNSCTSVGSEGYAIKNSETLVGYFGLKALPSHTWGTNAVDATLFECTVCGAILKNGNAKGTLIPAAQFGNDKINEEDGITISYFQISANSDWNSIVARTKYGAVNIDSPNLQTNVMTGVPGEMAELKAKLNNENIFPSSAGAILEKGYAWDSIKLATNAYVTVTVHKGVGIVYYLNGNKMLTYPATMVFGNGTVDDFIRLFMLCAAEEGMYVATTQFAGAIEAVDALVQKGALSDAEAANRYQLYMQERDLLKELETHVHSYTNADHTCNCGALDPLYDYPTYNTTNTFEVGVTAMNEAKTLAWVNYIQRGEKFVFTGTHKSESADNWAGINVALGSYKAIDSAIIRVDRWVDNVDAEQNDNGGKDAAENWTFTKSNTSFNDWAGVHAAARKNGNVTITIDWTNETQIKVTIALENSGTTTAFDYVFSAITGSLRDRYNFALGCGLSYSSLKVTEAPARSDAPTAVNPET